MQNDKVNYKKLAKKVLQTMKSTYPATIVIDKNFVKDCIDKGLSGFDDKNNKPEN